MSDRIAMTIAWLLPRWLVRWATMRLIAHATQGPYSATEVPALTAMEAVRRWDVPLPPMVPPSAPWGEASVYLGAGAEA